MQGQHLYELTAHHCLKRMKEYFIPCPSGERFLLNIETGTNQMIHSLTELRKPKILSQNKKGAYWITLKCEFCKTRFDAYLMSYLKLGKRCPKCSAHHTPTGAELN